MRTIKVRDLREKARFIKHEPCPMCKSRDNVGVYDDGSKWCFGCGFYVPPSRSLQSSPERPKEDNSFSDYSFSSCIAPKALNWLKSYQITEEEIEYYGLLWEPKRELLIYPMMKDDKIIGFSGRYFGLEKSHPKYTNKGRFLVLPIVTLEPGSDTCIVVEDIVSAMKVGRVYQTLPLFGSQIPTEALKTLAKDFKRVGVWLDKDKVKEAFLAVSSAVLKGVPNVFRIHTEFDPKVYHTGEIRRIVEQAGGAY